MSSSDFHPAPRRRRRPRRLRRAVKLAFPFLLLIAVGLLSAGVIHLVESTAAAPIPSQFESPAPARDRDALPNPREGFGATQVPVQLDGILPTSFLEAAGSSPSERQALPKIDRGFEGPGASLQWRDAPLSARLVPEPNTALLLAMGLGCMGIQRRR